MPGVFFIWGDSEGLYRTIAVSGIRGNDDNGQPNCMRMSDGELMHLPFSSLIEICERVQINYE